MINLSMVDDSIMTNAKYNYLDTGKEYYLCLKEIMCICFYFKSSLSLTVLLKELLAVLLAVHTAKELLHLDLALQLHQCIEQVADQQQIQVPHLPVLSRNHIIQQENGGKQYYEIE